MKVKETTYIILFATIPIVLLIGAIVSVSVDLLK